MKAASFSFHLRCLARAILSGAFYAVFLCAALLPPFSLHPSQDKEGKDFCPSVSPRELYERLRREVFSRNSYAAVYRHESYRGENHEIYARMRVQGKYLREPARYYEKRLWVETSFPEQAAAGYQEIYSGKDDLTRILLPGALRTLGVITLFPEDPKADYLNRENLKTKPVWKWFDQWDRMLARGRLSARCEKEKGKKLLVLELTAPQDFDPLYHHQRVKVFVDLENWFPIRAETYRQGDPRPVVVFKFEELDLNPGFTEKDLDFSGLAPGWSLAGLSVPRGPRLETLKKKEPRAVRGELSLEEFLALFDQGLSRVNAYETTLELELRYHRLRQLRRDRFICFREPLAFSAQTLHLEANYIALNAGEGFRTVFDPEKDRLLHVLPAGLQRVMGEQTFPLSDPRLFSPLGDNIAELNFFSLRKRLGKFLEAAGETRTGMARYEDLEGPPGPWVEVREKQVPVAKRPSIMRVLLDPVSHLPRRVEYLGYDDPEGFLSITFNQTRVNPGLAREALWK